MISGLHCTNKALTTHIEHMYTLIRQLMIYSYSAVPSEVFKSLKNINDKTPQYRINDFKMAYLVTYMECCSWAPCEEAAAEYTV